MKMELFYDKIMADSKFVELLGLLKEKQWNNISGTDRIEVFKKITERLNLAYKEFGKCEFNFDYMGEFLDGENLDDIVMINVNMIEDGNQFDVLCTCLHELRHFYQSKSVELYNKKGIVHELFTEEEVKQFKDNFAISELGNAYNYFDYNPNCFYEYLVQPIEYDATLFSSDFLKLLCKDFITESIDYSKCKAVWHLNDRQFDNLKEHKEDLISYSHIYSLNYEDYINDNKDIFKSDRQKAKKYRKFLENIDEMDEKDVLLLFSPCFWNAYDVNEKLSLLNKYLSKKDYSFDICSKGSRIYVDDFKIGFGGNDSFELFEYLYNKMAMEEIKKITSETNINNLDSYKKDIWFNCRNKENIVDRDKNPLLYNLQPAMIYRNRYVYKKLDELYTIFNSLYEEDNMLFDVYNNIIRKYDVEVMIKKAEILTQKSFKDIYEEMVNKMTKQGRNK